MKTEKNPDSNLSERLRNKIREAQEFQNDQYLTMLPAEAVTPPDPDTDKNYFSAERKTYESYLNALNSNTLTGNEFDEIQELDEALAQLNQSVNSFDNISEDQGMRGIIRKIIKKLITFALGNELAETRKSLSEVTRSLNIINHKTRIFVGKQQAYNTDTAKFGQSIVPIIDEKIRYHMDINATYLKDRMDSFHEETDRRQNEIANWLHNTASSLEGFTEQLNTFESELKRGLALQHKKIEQSLAASSSASGKAIINSDENDNSTFAATGGDYAYYLFETQGRGSEESISLKQFEYISFFRDVCGPVLDIGCGRGEFLSLLKTEKIESRGIDANIDMVAICKDKGLNVVHGDAIKIMAAYEDNTFGGIFAGQVVEHLESKDLVQWLHQANRILKPGGILLFETINTSSPFALTSFFFKDPTHKLPRHPETYRFLTEIADFEQVTVTLHSPVDTSVIPETVSIIDDNDSAQLAESLKEVNAALEKISNYVFAPCDILVYAKKPGKA